MTKEIKITVRLSESNMDQLREIQRYFLIGTSEAIRDSIFINYTRVEKLKESQQKLNLKF
jgi:hypothetical protein